MSRRADIDRDVVETQGIDLALLARLAGFARPHLRHFALSFGVLAVLFGLQLLGPWVVRALIDGPVRAAGLELTRDGAVDVAARAREIVPWVAGYVAIVAAQIWVSYYEVAQLVRTGQLVIHDLRVRLFEHLLRLDTTYYDSRPTGSVVTRVTSDVETLNELFTSGLIALVFDLAKVALVLAVLYVLDWRLALVVTATTPLLVLVSVVFRGGARRAYRRVRARLARLNGYLQEVLSGMAVVQIFGRERAVGARFDRLLEEHLAANLQSNLMFALFFPAISFATVVTQAAALWVGGEAIEAGQLTYGGFVQFWMYLALLVTPIRELGERYNVLQSAFAAGERIFQILDTRPAVRPPAVPAPVPATPDEGAPLVRFDRVSFAYPGGEDVLRDVSFELPRGRTVAVVGATGAGKSTLVNLLLRFHDPRGGRVTWAGADLRELDLDAYRGQFGLVLQEDFLFSGTVRDNLVMGRARVTPERLARALEMSRAADLVARLPDGLDTEVLERGAGFSSGERQLLAIARALAGDPELVVLDEATSSVDSATEARIEDATHNLLEERSALVIAHRLSTVRRADRILVLHHGELRESGTHAELLAARGLYARLHALAFRDDLDLAPPPPGAGASEER